MSEEKLISTVTLINQKVNTVSIGVHYLGDDTWVIVKKLNEGFLWDDTGDWNDKKYWIELGQELWVFSFEDGGYLWYDDGQWDDYKIWLE